MMTPRWLPLLLLLSCGVSAQTDTTEPMVATPSLSQDATDADPAARAPWSSRTLDAVQHWPLQHGGRVKPFDTFAGFIMLKVNGKRSLTVNQEKLGPVAWALDCMLYPELARSYECIRVTNSEVLTNAGIDVSQRKRSARWSFDDLLPAFDQIFETALTPARNHRPHRDVVLPAVAVQQGLKRRQQDHEERRTLASAERREPSAQWSTPLISRIGHFIC